MAWLYTNPHFCVGTNWTRECLSKRPKPEQNKNTRSQSWVVQQNKKRIWKKGSFFSYAVSLFPILYTSNFINYVLKSLHWEELARKKTLFSKLLQNYFSFSCNWASVAEVMQCGCGGYAALHCSLEYSLLKFSATMPAPRSPCYEEPPSSLCRCPIRCSETPGRERRPASPQLPQPLPPPAEPEWSGHASRFRGDLSGSGGDQSSSKSRLSVTAKRFHLSFVINISTMNFTTERKSLKAIFKSDRR